jgi:hypothetical protein
MYDEYVPDPPLTCPVDGATLDQGFQGKDGPSVLAVYRQGQHIVGDYGTHGYTGPSADAEDFPDDGVFQFYGSHGGKHGHWVDCEGTLVDGVWTSSRVIMVTEDYPRGAVIWGQGGES